MHLHRFNKEAAGWFIDLPEYINQGGSKADLEMIDGADTMLDIMAGAAPGITLAFDDKPLEGADKLLLLEKCDPFIGGGNYTMPLWEGKTVDQPLWLCAVTEFVFNYIPDVIYVKRVKSEI